MTRNNNGTDVAVVDDIAELQPILMGTAELVFEDPELIVQKITERQLAAASIGDLFADSGVTPATDVLGVPLTQIKTTWHRSTFEGEGPGAYALLEARRMDTDEPVVVSCGARDVLVKLWKCQTEGWEMPPVKIIQASKPTAAGFYPMALAIA